MKRRVAILISGSGSNMLALIDAMKGDHPGRAVLVVSSRPGAGGLSKARARGVATTTVDHRLFKGDREAFEAALHQRLSAAAPDVICLAGFMRILTPAFIARWQGRMLNIHPSLLPRYRGLHTHARAIAANDSHAGCSVHEVTADLDAGPVMGRAKVAIAPGDTPGTLGARILIQGH
ncbi:MAG: phosphoribosylglycinamide formyltransferase, partial [Paracoccaceae bacterium]